MKCNYPYVLSNAERERIATDAVCVLLRKYDWDILLRMVKKLTAIMVLLGVSVVIGVIAGPDRK